ncbi:MAG: outer membrane beta-barrel protein, partial [Candidatus Omnitrophota bacterium]
MIKAPRRLIFILSVSWWLILIIPKVEALKIESWGVYPYVNVEQKYDDNIYLDPNNKKDDFITTLGLGVTLEKARRRYGLKLDYRADFIKYYNYTREDTEHHTLSCLVDLKLIPFRLRFEDSFERTSDPADSEKTAREDRIRNISSLKIIRQQDRLEFEMGYSNITDDYDNDSELDKLEDILTLTSYYKFFPKVSFLLEYNYGQICYDETTHSDSNYNQIRVGFKSVDTAKLSGLVKVGYQKRDYKEQGKGDFEGLSVFANLTEKLSSRTKVELSSDWAVNESSYSTNNYYVLSGLGLKLTHKLGPKWTFSSEGSYYLNKYPQETTEGAQRAKREDDIWTGGFGLNYQLQKGVSLGIGY